jgi:hypothetical protein
MLSQRRLSQRNAAKKNAGCDETDDAVVGELQAPELKQARLEAPLRSQRS